MQQYKDHIKYILENGDKSNDRTGTGTLKVFGRQLRFNLLDGFPIVTVKKTNFEALAREMLWFISGDTNIKPLTDNGIKIWNEWATEDGELGPVYGKQWRQWRSRAGSVEQNKTVDGTQFYKVNYEYIDQLKELIDGLKARPNSRRHIMSAWNPSDLPDETITAQENVAKGKMALAPCHTFFQVFVTDASREDRIAYMKAKRRGNAYIDAVAGLPLDLAEQDIYLNTKKVPKRILSTMIYIRSSDTFLGLPYNIAQYALLTEMIAQQVGCIAGELVVNTGDSHIYANHVEQCKKILSLPTHPLPKLFIKNRPDDIFNYSMDNFELDGYVSGPFIKGDVAV